MKLRLFSLWLATLTAFLVQAQPVRLKLPRQINLPNYNHFAPSISADGLTMIFASDYLVTDGNSVDLKIAYNKGGDNWSSGEDVTVINKSGMMNLYGAHCISADANTIYFTTKKTGGVGGYDIWMTEKKGGNWSQAQNLGKPINSESMEGFPSISADGKYLFFVRCQTMSNQSCEDCKLYMAEHKGQGIFKEPTVLPANTNSTSILAPRIAKDGKTLTFSAKTPGSKGGYDLYMTKKTGENWSEPQNMDFLNTKDEDKYADFISQGDAVIYSAYTDGYLTLYKAKVPDNSQPSRVLLITGKASNESKKAMSGFLQISDNTTSLPISINRIDVDGKFTAVLPVGRSYDVAVTSGNNNFFWSNIFDATQLVKSRKEDVEATLASLVKGVVYHGNKPVFDSTTYQLLQGAPLECKRLAKLIAAHPDWKTEIIIFPSGISNNPPTSPENAYEKMKTAWQEGMAKAVIPADKISFANGYNTPEEENNYCGWAWRAIK